MKRILTCMALASALAAPLNALSLDPLAPRAQRSEGMIFVKTPNSGDTITITRSDGSTQTLQPEQVKWVPVGNYLVTAKMQEHVYNQNVLVQPTERTDVVVAGFGNLKVNSIHPGDIVEVINLGKGGVAAKFPASQIKTLPQGRYDVKINVGKTSVTKNNVWIVTNTTRQVDVTYADAGKGGI